MTVDAYPQRGLLFKTAPLYQYDYGQAVRLHLDGLPPSYLAEFRNSTRADVVKVIAQSDVVTVPAQVLESANLVYMWVVIVDSESRTTEYAIMIPVIARARPSETEPTPEQQSEIEAAIAVLNEAVEGSVAKNAVRYDTDEIETRTANEKAKARANIGAAAITDNGDHLTITL